MIDLSIHVFHNGTNRQWKYGFLQVE